MLPTGNADNAAIIAGWQDYWRVYDRFAADPSGFTDFTETQYVTTGEESNGILDALAHYRELGIRVLGGRKFENVRVGAISTAGDQRTAKIQYCTLPRGIRAIYADSGKPFERDIAPRFSEVATMQEGRDGIWRVALIRNKEGGC